MPPASNALCPYVERHRRHYDFRFLEPFGLAFATDVSRAFGDQIGAFASRTGVGYYGHLRASFLWIVSRRQLFGELFGELENGGVQVAANLWQDALGRWRDDLVNGGTQKLSTKAGYINTVNAVWGCLSGVLPEIRLHAPHGYWNSGGVKPTLGEVAGEAEDSAYQEALALLPARERANEQTQAAIRALLHDFGDVPQSKDELDRKLERVNADRLAKLRSRAERHLIDAYERFRRGQELLRQNNARAQEICDVLRVDGRRKARARARELSPHLRDCTVEQALANFLTFVDHEFNGLLPSRGEASHTFAFTQWAQPFGGVQAVEAHLFADPPTLVAALVILLIDCGWNPSTAIRLKHDCLRPSRRSGHTEIVSRKPRSMNKEDVATVPTKASAPKTLAVPTVVNMVRDMTARLRAAATDSTRDRLFLYRRRRQHTRPIRPLGETAGQYFKDLQQHWAGGEGPAYRLAMIRPSVLLARGLTAGLLAARITANHARPETTRGYVNRYALRAKQERQSRQFQSLFQAVAIQEIEGAAQELGVSVDEFTQTLQHAIRTGLGLLCRDPRAGVQPGTKRGEICTRQENCPSCSQMFFVATVENTADLILWHEYLTESGQEMQFRREDRWTEKWGPFLVLTEVLLKKLKRYGDIVEEAHERAAERRERGEVHFPPLL